MAEPDREVRPSKELERTVSGQREVETAAQAKDDEIPGSPNSTAQPTQPVIEVPAESSTPIEESTKTLESAQPASDSLNTVEPSSTLLPSPMEVTIPPPPTADEIIASHSPDSPTTSLISSLRSQLSILSDQSSALNTKLVAAISQHADLEDAHLNLKSSHAELQERAAVLSAEKAKWEESMNTGLLVERSQIKDEMQKLAAGLVEEERRRGSAETRRQKVEEEIDELAASLFDQANTMVAVERMARTEAETRLKSTEENLTAAESAMRDMQLHLQSLPLPSHSPPSGETNVIPRRYLASHLPFTEFISFIAHLRSLRPLKETSKAMFPPPPIVNLLAQPFVARAVMEDHDPTIRLDAAPDLSYFSRRNVGPAIIAGELIIEPVSATTVISSSTGLPHDISCTLCGKPVFPHLVPQSPSASHFAPPPLHPAQSKSRFSLKPFFNATSPNATTGSTSASPTQTPLASPSPAGTSSSTAFGSVYVFRVNKLTTTAGANDKEAKVYPLCKTGWCLGRLRATCELWHFVRTGIIHPVWHGDDGYVLQAEQSAKERDDPTPTPGDRRVSSSSAAGEVAPPPLPERKKSTGWGLGFKLAAGNRTSSSSSIGEGGSGGGGGWFGRSASATPPRSPVTPALDITEKENPPAQNSLEAPIDLDSPLHEKKDGLGIVDLEKERGGVPRIQEVEASPAAPRRSIERVSQDGAEKEGDTLRPVLSRSGSLHSTTTSAGGTEEATFSTPKGQDSELPEDDEKADSPKVDQVEETNSKVAATLSIGTHAGGAEEGGVVDLTEDAPVLAQPTPAPPPIPRRAANRMSQPPTPTVTEIPPTVKSKDDTLEEEDKPGAETVARAAPPPLPARHPKTPTAVQVKESTPEGEKRWIKENSDVWEEKAWRMIVKLKEGMWRARIGVNDEAEE